MKLSTLVTKKIIGGAIVSISFVSVQAKEKNHKLCEIQISFKLQKDFVEESVKRHLAGLKTRIHVSKEVDCVKVLWKAPLIRSSTSRCVPKVIKIMVEAGDYYFLADLGRFLKESFPCLNLPSSKNHALDEHFSELAIILHEFAHDEGLAFANELLGRYPVKKKVDTLLFSSDLPCLPSSVHEEQVVLHSSLSSQLPFLPSSSGM
jgi:hypothetical protein